MNIAVDIDEVISSTLPAFLQYYNSVSGTDFCPSDFFSSDWAECLGLSQEVMGSLLEGFSKSAYLANVVPIKGAIDTLNVLSAKVELHAVTSRWGALLGLTEPWLEQYFPGIFVRVHFSRTSHSNPGKSSNKRKSEICKQIDAVVILEDCPRHAMDCIESGIPVVLFDRPWNENLSAERLFRVLSWNDVTAAIAWLHENNQQSS